jgi:NAD(P)-dependent dehydrogenase (short-subunit alcohol dehydrogenase family)
VHRLEPRTPSERRADRDPHLIARAYNGVIAKIGQLVHRLLLTDLGGIDLLVNNAGAGHRGTFEQLTMEELSHAIALNSFGVARVTKAVLPAMRTARTGRVISVTSLNGVVALPFSDAYNAAKFAVEGLMEMGTVMREFGVYISVLGFEVLGVVGGWERVVGQREARDRHLHLAVVGRQLRLVQRDVVVRTAGPSPTPDR